MSSILDYGHHNELCLKDELSKIALTVPKDLDDKKMIKHTVDLQLEVFKYDGAIESKQRKAKKPKAKIK